MQADSCHFLFQEAVFLFVVFGAAFSFVSHVLSEVRIPTPPPPNFRLFSLLNLVFLVWHLPEVRIPSDRCFPPPPLRPPVFAWLTLPLIIVVVGFVCFFKACLLIVV